MQTQTTAAEVPVPHGVPMCTHHTGCTDAATFGFIWAWGEKGLCCSKHQFELNQAAENISRTIMFSPLNPDAAPVVDRPERIALTSRALAAEAECEDARQRGVQLYRQNTELTTQVQALTLRNRASNDALTVARAELKKVSDELLKRDAEHGELFDEVSRLRVLVGAPAAGEEVTQVTGGSEGKGKAVADDKGKGGSKTTK